VLDRLEFENLGPSPRMAFSLGERLNLFTGDNGLGKTFVLDAAWWALTRTWPEGRALKPDPKQPGVPRIGYHCWGREKPNTFVWCDFDFRANPPEWKLPRRRPPIPGLVLYARVDGGFSIWDPARNYWREDNKAPVHNLTRPSAYHFNREQIWSGLWRTAKDEYEKNRDALICRGLLEDLVSWQLDPSEADATRLFSEVLAKLSPDPKQPYRLGPLGELLGWTGKLPTLITPQLDRPLLLEFVSSGVRRMLALAYALTWAWTEHRRALRLTQGNATEAHRIVLLIDEVENHLHPHWQRLLLPALLAAANEIAGQATSTSVLPVQILATTHAPLVLSSLETQFHDESDRLFNFELVQPGEVKMEQIAWAKFGDAAGWLASPAFDLMAGGYSVEAEKAMQVADNRMLGLSVEGDLSIEGIHAELSRTLDGSDPYWTFWLPFYRSHSSQS
jgi:hypothetical protein